MACAGRKAKLLPDLVGTKPVVPAGDRMVASAGDNSAGPALPAPPIASLAVVAERLSLSGSGAAVGGQAVLCRKGAATAQTFQPSYWSYDAKTLGEGSRLDCLPVTEATLKSEVTGASSPVAEASSGDIEPPAVHDDAREAEESAARQALAAGLAEMIESVLRTHQFAAIIAHKVRYRSREIPQTPASVIEPSAIEETISAGAVGAEPALSSPGPVATVRSAEPWIDRMLGLVGFAMVVPACFFALSLWRSDAREVPQAPPVAVSASSLGTSSVGAIESRQALPAAFGRADGLAAGAINFDPARNKTTR
jgi:hypothetical protein